MALVLLGFAAMPAVGSSGTPAPIAFVTVTAGVPTESSFTFSTQSTPIGVTTFTVRNHGKVAHAFEIAGRRTAVIEPGHSTKLTIEFTKARAYPYRSWLRGQAGMAGTFRITQPKTAPATSTTATVAACASPTAKTTVTVQMFEFGFTFSQTTIPCGIITFQASNTGQLDHNLDVTGVSGGDGEIIHPGASTTMTVSIVRPGTYFYLCDVRGHASLGMQGSLTISAS